MKRLRKNRKGVSNVIVVMLSLVLITIIVSNVVLWSYQMNQLDLERIQETVAITNAARLTRSSWFTSQYEYSIIQGNRLSGTFTDTKYLDNLHENFEGNMVQDLTFSYPTAYVPKGSTQLISGSLTDLQSDNNIYMTFLSYATASSGQTLYAHQETSTIDDTNYRSLERTSADAAGTSLSASMDSTGRILLDKAVYPLAGITQIPASTWTNYYRTWKDADPLPIVYNNASSLTITTPATSMSWSHTTGMGSNRFLVVAIEVHVATGTPTTVTSVTYAGVSLTQITTALYSATNPQVRTYIFSLTNPALGTNTITVGFTDSTLAVAGAVTYFGVDQTIPVQMGNTATGSGTAQSVSVTVSDIGKAVFGHLAGHRTAAVATQVTFVSAGTGSGVTVNPSPAYPTGLLANDLILLQVTVRDTTNTPTTPTGFTLLHGPDSTGTGRQWIYYKISDGTETGTITVTISGSNCKMARMYAFRNADITSFSEDGGFGSGTGATISAQSVTTMDAKRLAVSFVFVNDDNAVGSFAGETGGDWTEAVSEFTTTSGSDGCVQLQTATMASAGAISSGSFVMSAADPWGVRAFALTPSTAWTITEGNGQNQRWTQTEELYKGVGSDKLDVTTGSVSMNWTTDFATNWVCSALVVNPATPALGHIDVDILIRKSDNTERATIATNVANSDNVDTNATTLSATYSWTEYTVVDQTDYLEVDYYVEVTTACANTNAYLRIDDSTLAIADQTRVHNIMLPTENTIAVEFLGTASTEAWTQLIWTIDSSFTTSSVTATFQLFNYSAGEYSISENGYMTDIIGTSDLTKNQTIVDNASDFRDTAGNWKTKITGVKATQDQFDIRIDWIELLVITSNTAPLNINNNFTIDLPTYPQDAMLGIEIYIKYNVTQDAERYFIRAYNWTDDSFSDGGFNTTTGNQPVSNSWNNYSISINYDWTNYIHSNGTLIIEFFDEAVSTNQSIIEIDFFGVSAIVDGTRLDIRNSSPFTTHIIALWIINSTSHQRYNVDYFINSAENKTYSRLDLKTSDDFIAKIITERGNVAVFP